MINIIDNVRLKLPIQLDVRRLQDFGWIEKKSESFNNPQVINVKYVYVVNNVTFVYYDHQNVLRVIGRFINLSNNANRVDNLDSLYQIVQGYVVRGNNLSYYEEDLDDVLNKINRFLRESTGIYMDVRDYSIEKVEVCLNVKTPHVWEYVSLMNHIFIHKSDPRYTNYVVKNNLPLGSSCYIKTKREYEKNSNQNRTINFYNKLDQLQYRRVRNRHNKINDYDLHLAEGVLRLEVKVNYFHLRRVFKKNKLDFTLREFLNILDLDLCAEIIKDEYRYFFSRDAYLDFYSYKWAKSKVKVSSLSTTTKRNLLTFMVKQSGGHTVSKKSLMTNRKKLAELGIHYYFIPKKMGIDYLPSPMKLLDEKVKDCHFHKALHSLTEEVAEHIVL